MHPTTPRRIGLFIVTIGLTFFAAGCGDDSSEDCPEGEKKFRYPSDASLECYQTCDSDGDCPEGQACVNDSTHCAVPRDGDDADGGGGSDGGADAADAGVDAADVGTDAERNSDSSPRDTEPDSSGPCSPGEQLYSYPPGSDAECYKTCDRDAECPTGETCIQSTLCAPPRGDAGSDTGVQGDARGWDLWASSDGSSCASSGSKSCEEVYDCVQACSNRTCATNCVQQGTCTAQNRFRNYRTCVQSNCGSGSAATCVPNQCELQLRSCGLVDNSTCAEVRTCRMKCRIKVHDQASSGTSAQRIRELVATCIGQTCPDGDISAQKEDARIDGCIDANNCNQSGAAPDCEFKQCASEFQNCGLLGNKSCRNASLCYAGCPSSDYACQAQCYWNASATARARQAKLYTCFDRNGCKFAPDPLDCFYNNCTTELQKCEKVGGVKSCTSPSDCPSSTRTCSNGTCVHATCKSVFQCLQNCTGSRCIAKCGYDATPTAQKKYRKYLRCLGNNGGFQRCPPSSTCAQNNCGSLYGDCAP